MLIISPLSKGYFFVTIIFKLKITEVGATYSNLVHLYLICMDTQDYTQEQTSHSLEPCTFYPFNNKGKLKANI